MNPGEFANIARAEQQFWWYRGMNRIMFGLLDPVARTQRFHRVLEAGCGTGYFARLLQKRYAWEMFPVDLGWEGLQLAESYGLGNLTQATVAQLPFPNSTFDAVVSMDVIVHFPRGEERQAISEMGRVLSPGGLLVMRVSALDLLRSRHSEFALERQRFTRRRLVGLVESCGVEVLRCTYANAFLLPVALAKFRIWEPLARKPPASGVRPLHALLDRLLYIPLHLESMLLARGVSFSTGQSLILLGRKGPG